MSATIHYRKMSQSDPYIKNVMAPSSFIDSLRRAFGTFPCILGPAQISTLEGMAAMWEYDIATLSEDNNPYQEIIGKIEELGSIELYATY